MYGHPGLSSSPRRSQRPPRINLLQVFVCSRSLLSQQSVSLHYIDTLTYSYKLKYQLDDVDGDNSSFANHSVTFFRFEVLGPGEGGGDQGWNILQTGNISNKISQATPSALWRLRALHHLHHNCPPYQV